jgi:hypothetical protein
MPKKNLTLTEEEIKTAILFWVLNRHPIPQDKKKLDAVSLSFVGGSSSGSYDATVSDVESLAGLFAYRRD